MGPFEMVTAIVGITALASVIRLKHNSRGKNGGAIAHDPDSARLRDEVKGLKERIAVLERLATDENGARVLDREIEKLR